MQITETKPDTFRLFGDMDFCKLRTSRDVIIRPINMCLLAGLEITNTMFHVINDIITVKKNIK